jgi:glucosylceramidase
MCASYPQNVLNGVGQYVDTVAWHCYASNLNWNVLTQFHQRKPSVKQYMTECWTPKTGAWDQVAGFTMGPLQNWASGVVAWTLGTLSSGGCATCLGLVTISNGGYDFETAHYIMA